jgi:hypothetical protein
VWVYFSLCFVLSPVFLCVSVCLCAHISPVLSFSSGCTDCSSSWPHASSLFCPDLWHGHGPVRGATATERSRALQASKGFCSDTCAASEERRARSLLPPVTTRPCCTAPQLQPISKSTAPSQRPTSQPLPTNKPTNPPTNQPTTTNQPPNPPTHLPTNLPTQPPPQPTTTTTNHHHHHRHHHHMKPTAKSTDRLSAWQRLRRRHPQPAKTAGVK